MKPFSTSGFRKAASARAQVRAGSGKIRINKIPLEQYGTAITRLRVQEPMLIAPEVSSKIDVDINVNGGGHNGQADAARLAIGRAIAQIGGEKVREVLVSYDRALLVADTRYKETRKPNDSKARAKRQKSYR